MQYIQTEKCSIDYRKYNLLIFIICMTLYGINRSTKFHDADESILKYIWDYNFTDFLCQLVYFSLCNIFLETFRKRGIYSFRTLMFLSAICCLYWEIGVLRTRTQAVFDAADWIAYLLGAMSYYWIFINIINRRKK